MTCERLLLLLVGLADDICSVLPGKHSFTGCATVNAFKNMVVFYTNYSRKPGRVWMIFSLQNYVFSLKHSICICLMYEELLHSIYGCGCHDELESKYKFLLSSM